MNYRLKITFSDQPIIDDSVTINAQFIETFKASRNNPGEVAIGATLADTITNLESAVIADYQGLFPFTSSIEGNTLILNFVNYNDTFFDIGINSSVITFELITEYIPYFRSQYDNRVDDFEIVILGKDLTVNEQQIQAIGTLSYKDVDNTLEPIRGAQLDIEIDANIDKPFDLFLDFREKDFKVEFYRNDDLIFEGFINPEGVAQDYTSINWKAKLTAFDNLGSLKNKEFTYNNELPSEFVFMDLCLKQTGLNLPIAFFDDINQNKKNGVVTVPYGAELNDGLNERIIEPEVFINDNDTFADCETILKDILQKYNACLFMQNITYYTLLGVEVNKLCWVFCRIPLLQQAFLETQRPFKVKQINNYSGGASADDYKIIFNNDDLVVPIISDLGSFNSINNTLGTHGQNGLDAIHKNKNQLLRQKRALQNFRFEHKYIVKKSFYNYFYNNFSLIETYNPTLGFNLNDNLAFRDYRGGFDQLKAQFVSDEISIPNSANLISLKGSGTVTPLQSIAIPSGRQILGTLMYTIVHKDVDGNFSQMKAITDSSLPFGSPRPTDYIGVEFEDISNVYPSNITDFSLFSFLIFSIYKFTPYDVSFDINNISLPSPGGSLKIYISQFTTPVLGITQQESEYSYAEQFWRRTQLELKEFNVNFTAPENTIGEGEYHDAKNLQDVSSKIDNPVKVINADENTNIFLNGLKRIVNNELVNYDYWTSSFNLQQDKENLLELTSIERIRLLSKSQNIFSGDIHGYVPFFARLVNTAYSSDIHFMFTKWEYDTANNTISAEMMENDVRQPSVDYEKTIIFEDEDKKLID